MEAFLGKWKSESSEGFEDYLKALGVALPIRKIALLQNPCYEVIDNGDGSYTAKQITAFKTHSITFKLDEQFAEEAPDGRKLMTTCSLKDGKLIQTQMLNGELSSELIREIIDGKLKTSATAKSALYVRIYTKSEK